MTPLPVIESSESTALGWFKTIELEINTACDLACFGCDRFSDVASKGVPNMTVGQVSRFVDESIELGWRWERIRLLGGEPTIHPQFRECCEQIMRYRASYPDVFLQVLSNGQGKYTQYKRYCEDNRISLHTELKQKGVQPPWFNNTRIVPADRDPSVGAIEPCGIYGPHGCGIGLTRHGYFMDGTAASIARVAGYDIGCMTLAEVTHKNMMGQAGVICRVCGHWNPRDATPDNGKVVTQLVSLTGHVTGDFWTRTLAAYNTSKPVLRIYGETV